MTWLDMANLLFDKSGALSPCGAHLHLDTASWLRTSTAHQNQIADAAVRYFAKKRHWPELTPASATQVYFRCLFAIERCIGFESQGPQAPATVEAEQVAFASLLIDSWHLEGMDWAAQRYQTRFSERRYDYDRTHVPSRARG